MRINRIYGPQHRHAPACHTSHVSASRWHPTPHHRHPLQALDFALLRSSFAFGAAAAASFGSGSGVGGPSPRHTHTMSGGASSGDTTRHVSALAPLATLAAIGSGSSSNCPKAAASTPAPKVHGRGGVFEQAWLSELPAPEVPIRRDL
jgi:hypothetical protein